MAARIKAAVDLVDLVLELHSHALQPLDGVIGVGGHSLDEFGIRASVAALERLFGVKLGAVLDALLLLTNRVIRIEAAARNLGVAAGEGHLFKNENVLDAVLGGRNGSRQTAAAGADDQQVDGRIPFRGLFSGSVGSLRKGDGRQKAGRAQSCTAEQFSSVDGGHFLSPGVTRVRR